MIDYNNTMTAECTPINPILIQYSIGLYDLLCILERRKHTVHTYLANLILPKFYYTK